MWIEWERELINLGYVYQIYMPDDHVIKLVRRRDAKQKQFDTAMEAKREYEKLKELLLRAST